MACGNYRPNALVVGQVDRSFENGPPVDLVALATKRMRRLFDFLENSPIECILTMTIEDVF